MHMACQVLYTQKTFCKEALKNNWLTPKGFLSTKAEIGYRYLSNENDFDEEHMGLQDVLIEMEILDRCFRQHKKMDDRPYKLSWKIPTTYHKQHGNM